MRAHVPTKCACQPKFRAPFTLANQNELQTCANHWLSNEWSKRNSAQAFAFLLPPNVGLASLAAAAAAAAAAALTRTVNSIRSTLLLHFSLAGRCLCCQFCHQFLLLVAVERVILLVYFIYLK